MICRDNTKAGRKFGPAEAFELVDVYTQAKAQSACGGQDLLRNQQVKDIRLTENIAIFSEVRRANLRQHFMDDQFGVLLGMAAELVWHFVSAEKSRHAS